MKSRVFIVCGGPSLKDVKLGWLRTEDTIAVNYMGKFLPEPTYFLTADSGVIKNAVEQNFWGMTKTRRIVVINPKEHPRWEAVKQYVATPIYDEWIVPTRWDGVISTTPEWNDFATGKNTGFCALQYAVKMGYKEIYLMGVDLQTAGGRKYYYSDDSGSSPYDLFYKHYVTGLERLKKANIKVYSCSPVSRLNGTIPFVPWESLIPTMPVFVSHYTVNTEYETIVNNLILSLKNFKLDYDIEPTPNLGSWRLNSNYCATQVRQMLDRHEPRSIVRIDADAVINEYPRFFDGLKADFSAVIYRQSRLRPKGELMGGTLFFGSTAGARSLVDGWLARLEKRPHSRNPDLLQAELAVNKQCKFAEMPISYCRIFDFPNMGPQKVIEHFQASRRCKGPVNQQGMSLKT